MRVDDYEVERYLIWARNYGEVQSFTRVATRGRKWQIVLPASDPTVATASGAEPSLIERSIVPTVLFFTSREALAFGMGCAVAGARERRSEFAAREWDW